MKKEASLQREIEKARQTIKSDAYSISLSELISQYENREIEIHPEFQRLFRWTPAQKSRLIETILLGIPLPSIFVMQKQDAVWELIDGLQRTSTILEFVGKLRDEKGKLKPPSKLKATEYLPSLEGMQYESKTGPSFTQEQRLAFRRAKINVTILLPESDVKARGELFDRLNTGGTQATPQEIRFARFVMEDPAFAAWLKELNKNQNFQSVVQLSDRLVEERYDMELIGRYIATVDANVADLKQIDSIEEFLTERLIGLLYKGRLEDPTAPNVHVDSGWDMLTTPRYSVPQGSREEYHTSFERTFRVIDEIVGGDAFRRYDVADDKFKGSFSVSAYEFVTCGIGANIDKWEAAIGDPAEEKKLTDLIKNSWSDKKFREPSGRGSSSRTRLKEIVPYARKYFA